MKEFTESFGFIITFLTFSLFTSMLFGRKALNALLWLILAGMVYTNWSKIEQVIRRNVANG